MNLKQEFIEAYGKERFPHAEELFAALGEGDCKISVYREKFLPCSHYARVFRRRSEYATAHHPELISPELYDDCVKLYKYLERTPDEDCCVWSFTFPNGKCFAVYEIVGLRKIAGCLQTFEARDEIDGAI